MRVVVVVVGRGGEDDEEGEERREGRGGATRRASDGDGGDDDDGGCRIRQRRDFGTAPAAKAAADALADTPIAGCDVERALDGTVARIFEAVVVERTSGETSGDDAGR